MMRTDSDAGLRISTKSQGGRTFCPGSVRMVWATRSLNDKPSERVPHQNGAGVLR
jgi:hypothetical protein